jgi:putative heme-binding domain-containing protein
MKELGEAEISRALSDEHPGVVRNAILLAETRIAESDSVLRAVVALVDHPDAKVKLQLALTLGESTSPVAGEALAKLVRHGVDDPWLARAIVSSSKHHSLVVLQQLLSQLRGEHHSAESTNRQVEMIAELIATANAAGSNPSALVARVIAEADEDAPWVLPLAAACANSAGSAEKLDAASREAIVTVYERAKRLVGDEAGSPARRRQAMQLFGRSLGPMDAERSLLVNLLAPATPLDVQLAAVERLTAFRDRQSAEQLLSRWSNLSYSVRDVAAQRLISSAASIESVIEKLEAGEILPGDLSPSVRQSLRQSHSQSLQARINRVLGKIPAVNQELIQRYLQFQLGQNGTASPTRGHELFQKHCAACHIPDDAGRSTGPNLSNLTDRSRATLTEAILAPNRAVEPQYRAYVVTMADGRVLTGTISEEAGGDTLVLGLADGKRATVRRSEIEDFRSTGITLMPEGFQQELDPAMLRDVIEYMRSDSFVQSSSTQ